VHVFSVRRVNGFLANYWCGDKSSTTNNLRRDMRIPSPWSKISPQRKDYSKSRTPKKCNLRIKCSRLGAFEELLMQILDWHEMCAAGKVGLHYWKENEINFFLFLVFCSYKPDPETTDELRSLLIPAVGCVKNWSCDFCSFCWKQKYFQQATAWITANRCITSGQLYGRTVRFIVKITIMAAEHRLHKG